MYWILVRVWIKLNWKGLLHPSIYDCILWFYDVCGVTSAPSCREGWDTQKPEAGWFTGRPAWKDTLRPYLWVVLKLSTSCYSDAFSGFIALKYFILKICQIRVVQIFVSRAFKKAVDVQNAIYNKKFHKLSYNMQVAPKWTLWKVAGWFGMWQGGNYCILEQSHINV